MPVFLIKLFSSRYFWLGLAVLSAVSALFYLGYNLSDTKHENKDLKQEVVVAQDKAIAMEQTFQKTAEAINRDSTVTTKIIRDIQIIKQEIEVIPEPVEPAPVSPKVTAAIDWVRNYKPDPTPESVSENQENK